MAKELPKEMFVRQPNKVKNSFYTAGIKLQAVKGE